MSEKREAPQKAAPARESSFRGDAHLDVVHAKTELKRFLDLAVREMGMALDYEISSTEDETVIAFLGADQEMLLARDAELLLALEHVAHRWLRLDPRLHDRVRFDCGDYRASRLEELKLSARVAAQRVRETGESFRFNPMSPRERRLIHLELTGAAGIRTMSEGTGDRRQLVIHPAGKK
jgi:spoIIIJ-associated protein